MGRQHHKHLQPLTGQFLGWSDDRTPHRHIKLATANGERRVKIAKSLRAQIQDWQPGIWLTLMSQERICRTTGECKITAKQLLYLPTAPTSDSSPLASIAPVAEPPSTKIQVCGGSSCRRRGSDNICQSMQAYLDRYDLTTQVQIETVKCLHQCKAAPHAIVTPTATTSGKTHYRQLQPSQVQLLLAKHFSIPAPLPATVGTSLIEKTRDYLQQQQLASSLISNS
jgi:(2Fe-2S) ferredoxin